MLVGEERLPGPGLEAGPGIGPQDCQLMLDPASRVLTCGGRECRLTPAQASLMFLLLRAFPEPVRAESIWSHVRGSVPARPTSAVRVLVHELRAACRKCMTGTWGLCEGVVQRAGQGDRRPQRQRGRRLRHKLCAHRRMDVRGGHGLIRAADRGNDGW